MRFVRGDGLLAASRADEFAVGAAFGVLGLDGFGRGCLAGASWVSGGRGGFEG